MPNQATREQNFQLRARLIGRGFFICPHCGHQNNITLSPQSKWLVKCKHRSCHASFRIGLVFYPQPPGRSGRPSDIHPDPIQDAHLLRRRYRRGQPVHQVVEEGGEPE